MSTDNKIKKIDDSYSLTPWEKRIEKIIIVDKMTEKQKDDSLRLLAKLLNCMESRQHWAGDNYSLYLIEQAKTHIHDLPL